jgi:hypothetical protein
VQHRGISHQKFRSTVLQENDGEVGPSPDRSGRRNAQRQTLNRKRYKARNRSQHSHPQGASIYRTVCHVLAVSTEPRPILYFLADVLHPGSYWIPPWAVRSMVRRRDRGAGAMCVVGTNPAHRLPAGIVRQSGVFGFRYKQRVVVVPQVAGHWRIIPVLV